MLTRATHDQAVSAELNNVAKLEINVDLKCGACDFLCEANSSREVGVSYMSRPIRDYEISWQFLDRRKAARQGEGC